MNIAEIFEAFHEPPILVYPIHKQLFGRATTALLFSFICRQLTYHKRGKFFNTDLEVTEATGLTRDELELAKKHLKTSGIVAITREGGKGRTHYTLNGIALKTALKSLAVSGNSCFRESRKQEGAVSGKAGNTLREHTQIQSILHCPASAGRHVLHPRWLKYATLLCNAIRQVKKVNHTSKLKSWAKSISLIATQDKVEPRRIKAALKWYCARLPTHHGVKYFLDIQSGAAFREKFGRLEAAIAKERGEQDETNGGGDADTGIQVRGVVDDGDGADVEFD